MTETEYLKNERLKRVEMQREWGLDHTNTTTWDETGR